MTCDCRQQQGRPAKPARLTRSTANLACVRRRFGPLNTYTGFEPSDIPKVIDFVLPLGNGAFLPSSSRPPPPDSASDPEPGLGAEAAQPKWRVQRYGVVPNFFEDVGGRRGGPDSGSRQEGACDAMILSDHRLVVAAFQEVEGR